MKVIIPVLEDSPKSAIDPRFGRCKFYAIADTESDDITFIPYEEKDRGSGINAANHVLNFNPDAVIVGNIGPKAFQVLNKAGIAIYGGVNGNIEEILNLLKNGDLKPLTSATK